MAYPAAQALDAVGALVLLLIHAEKTQADAFQLGLSYGLN
jgi:hypothetical protein